MPPEERAALVAELFKSAAEMDDPAGRQAFLEERCRSNTELRDEVESLLRTQERAGQFMERAALVVAAQDFAREGAFAAGDVVGDYEIVSLIGKGGMGEVYLARDRQLHRNVALKLVRRGMDTEDIVRRFQHEQRLLAGLNHPNIALLHGAGLTEDGIPFFVMEHVDGTRIDEYCDAKDLPIPERLELFARVCGAVHYAHQHLVVHRDIKPSNILVTVEGEPKLLDFGIAKVLDPATNAPFEQTITLQNVMTPEYASPEHVRGESITTASDVYSLGVLLYELLTGSKPYEIGSHTPVEIVRIVAEQDPKRPSTAAKAGGSSRSGPNRTDSFRNSRFLKGDLDNIVLMAMRKEPERRYSSAAQLSGDIRRHLDGLPVTARKDTLAYRSAKFIRRNRLAVAAATIVLISIIAGLVIALWQAEHARAQRDLARREKSKAERLNRFLQTMLSFSNQSVTSVSPVASRRGVTVNEMLDQIAPRVETELADEPDVRAQVLRTLGSAYASQGLYDKAEKHLRAALAIQTRLRGESDAETAATLLELGVLTFRAAKLEEAALMLEKAVSFYQRGQRLKTSDYSPAHHALALDYLGCVIYHQGETGRALTLLRAALQLSSEANLQGNERGVITFNKCDLGAGLVAAGDQEGEYLLNEGIAEYRAMSGTPRWELGVALLARGIGKLNRQNLEDAERDLSESETILRQTLGDTNTYIGNNLDRQAAVLYQRQQFEAAEHKARESLQVYQSIQPDNKFNWAYPLWSLADIGMKGGRVAEAETYYREALAILEQQHAYNHLYIVRVKLSLAHCLLAQNRFDEAERLTTDTREEARKWLGDQSPLLKAASDQLGKISEVRAKKNLSR